MNIIIAGAGEVGYHLAKLLSSDDHDITVIDINPVFLDRVDASTDVLTIHGTSTSIAILEQAQVDKTDLLVAVTFSESVNITTAMLAKKLGTKHTIARVASAEYAAEENMELFKSMGIDHIIYPEELAAQEVVKLIERAAATDILEFEDGRLSLIGLKLDKSVPVLRKTMAEVQQEYNLTDFRAVAIHRGVRTIIPAGDDVFLPNDQIFVITTPEGHDEILKLSGKEDAKIQNIMILGGGKIGRKTARMLEDRMNVKLIDANPEKTSDLADYLQKALVIQGDGRDLDLLAQEGIIDMDAFIAVTDDAETNIITCLMAKHLNVSKTIAQVDNVDYIPLTQTIGLDSLINKKLITANNISRFIRKANIVTLATLHGIDAEVLEYVVKEKSQIIKNPVKDLKFPKNAIIGGYIRNEKGYIAVGDTQFKIGDRVVVFALPGAVSKVEKFFN
jgi:trk system potassium uptake protein TrkA